MDMCEKQTHYMYVDEAWENATGKVCTDKESSHHVSCALSPRGSVGGTTVPQSMSSVLSPQVIVKTFIVTVIYCTVLVLSK